MTLSRRYSDDADQDIFDIAYYFYERSEGAIHRFYGPLDKTIEMLCEHSELGEVFRIDTVGIVRYRIVTDFSNYVLFYRIEDTTLFVIRVLHGSRDYPNSGV